MVGSSRFLWIAQPKGRRTAWTVVGSEPVARGTWSVALALFPSARLELEADSAEFFVGNVPRCDKVPPNYTEADDVTVPTARLNSAFWPSIPARLFIHVGRASTEADPWFLSRRRAPFPAA